MTQTTKETTDMSQTVLIKGKQPVKFKHFNKKQQNTMMICLSHYSTNTFYSNLRGKHPQLRNILNTQAGSTEAGHFCLG